MARFFCSQKLNYTFVNEDGDFERNLLQHNAHHALVVAGSGSRLCHFLEKNPAQLTLIDLSQEQLWLAELRLEMIRCASFEDYLAFWGIGDQPFTPDERKKWFEQLSLQKSAKDYLRSVLQEHQWESILYAGRWEQTFGKMAIWMERMLGKKVIDKLFSFCTLEEQIHFLERDFPREKWNLLLRIFSSAPFFNLALYGKDFPRLNLSESYYQFFHSAFERCFRLRPARENFFLQIVLLGKVVHSAGLPPEFRPQVFTAAKQALAHCTVNFVQAGLVEWTAAYREEFDVIYCSDIPSYFRGEQARTWLQTCHHALKANGKLIARYYRHVPGPADAGGFYNLNNTYRSLFQQENTQVYAFDVLQKMEVPHG